MQAVCSFENIIPMFYRDVGPEFSFNDFFVADDPEFAPIKHELGAELQWAAERKTSGEQNDVFFVQPATPSAESQLLGSRVWCPLPLCFPESSSHESLPGCQSVCPCNVCLGAARVKRQR